MLKEAVYGNRTQGFGKVSYWISENGQDCVFSGMTPSGQCPSTINAAESIIQSIANVEGVHPLRLKFFDLLTSQSYGTHFERGYEFKLITFTVQRKEIRVEHWEDLPCPPRILKIFGV
ncbi:MAG: hypothetical protein WC477_01400 [Patescibacteria group bacterium]